VDATLKAFGPHIDILVNNAGIISDKYAQDITAEHFDEVMHTNVRAPLFMLQAVLPHLRRPGRIINLSSVGARQGYPSVGVYSASKAALEGFTRNWAAELGKDGTTVNAVNPGPVKSEMLDKVDPKVVVSVGISRFHSDAPMANSFPFGRSHNFRLRLWNRDQASRKRSRRL